MVAYITVDTLAPKSTAGAMVAIAALVCIFALIAAEMLHEGQLCPICAKRTPLNGAKFRRLVHALLWSFHHRLWGCLLVLVLIWVGILLQYLLDLPPWTRNLTSYTYTALFAWLSQAVLVHRVHRPWCPYCRDWRDGGFYEPSHDPTAPEKSKLPT